LWIYAEAHKELNNNLITSSTNYKKKEKEDKWPTTQERESWPSSFSLFVSSEDDRGREASVDR